MKIRLLRITILTLLFIIIGMPSVSAEVQRIYDQANLLTNEEIQELENQASTYFDEWETDFIIITADGLDGKDIMTYSEDFADELHDTFNRAEENMAVLTMDMQSRKVDLAGYGLAEEYLDDSRLDSIRNQITPDLSDENYYEAFEHFFLKADEYMNIRPGVNPESIFFNTFFQLAVAVILAGGIVFMMAYNSGGKVTTNSRTYMDQENTRIISKRDRYLRKTVTRRKKPSNKNKGGGGFGGGGGISGAGRSHSGSRGSF